MVGLYAELPRAARPRPSPSPGVGSRYALLVEEIAPGLWHWKGLRERIGSDLSSYYLAAERVLIDPVIPPVGLGWFEEQGRPEHLMLTNRPGTRLRGRRRPLAR